MLTLHDIFKQELKELRETQTIGAVYSSLFALVPEKDLVDLLEYLFELSEGKDSHFGEYGQKEWFGIWHKSIRQADFFNDCFQKREKQLLTKDEQKEFKFLNHKFRVDKAPKEGENGELFNAEYKRYLDLHERRRRESLDESINGHLDAILWNTIHLDTDHLYRLFLRTFALYKVELKVV